MMDKRLALRATRKGGEAHASVKLASNRACPTRQPPSGIASQCGVCQKKGCLDPRCLPYIPPPQSYKN
eukprot:1153000-Pelagomonas_calceolata.AAC.3